MTDRKIHIETERFTLKNLTTNDATLQYLRWLDEQSSSGYIVSAKQCCNIGDLRLYIQEREVNKDVIFLGIFTREQHYHIGNIKYEPINQALKYAVMGIMIGEKDWQGKGVASEVITASANWLKEYYGIEQIILGVDVSNAQAIRAYTKTGFVIKATDKINVDSIFKLSMILDI